MKIESILDRIDSGAVALPEFQRGYVWSRRQVRELVESLYRRFPVGSLLLWQTATEGADARGDAPLQPGYVSLLLDGQQRITSLYGLMRGVAPPFFSGDEAAFRDLRFHPGGERFAFYVPVTMRDDPLWIDVSGLMREGLGWGVRQLQSAGVDGDEWINMHERLNRLYTIRDIDLHAEEITGEDKTVDLVVELFNRVNTGGTKLSKGDLALAKICAKWPEARDEMNRRLQRWSEAGYHFSLDWLLRNITAILTGRSEFASLDRDDIDSARFRESLLNAERAIDTVLNVISTRLGLDHNRVLGSVGAIPLMSRFVADRGYRLEDQQTSDRLLFWYVHTLLWGRYAGSTETVLNIDLQHVVSERTDTLDALVGELRRQRGDLSVRADDFLGWSRGARFYPLLYMLTRMLAARDLGSGIELRGHLLGKRAALELHHVFPKALLQRHDYSTPERNALANFTFLTLDTNRALADRRPDEYLAESEARHPGVLASHWIPEDPALWSVERYPDFLAARRELLASAANRLLDDLWGGRITEPAADDPIAHGPVEVTAAEDAEAAEIAGVREWLAERGLRSGVEALALLGLDGMKEEAVLDLAWPDGLRYGTERLALLIDEPPEVHAAAARHGYRAFTNAADIRAHAERELLAEAT